MLCAYTMAGGAVRASRLLFASLLTTLLHDPMRFFDTTPRGRILNRVSEDVSNVDRVMPFTIRSMINCVLAGLASLFVVGFVTPWFLVSLPALAVVYYHIQVTCHRLLPAMDTALCWFWLLYSSSTSDMRKLLCIWMTCCLLACSMPSACNIRFAFYLLVLMSLTVALSLIYEL